MKKVLVVLVVLIAAFCGFVAMRPDSFKVERKTTIDAAPATVAAFVTDFHRWAEWSPWEKLDPAMKKTYDGAPGTGAKYAWVGNDQVGEGAMTITEAAADHVAIKLEFKKPFESVSMTTFTFAPTEARTTVTWAMEGKNNFVSKAMQVFMSMDDRIGSDFDRGLAALKAATEAEQARLKLAEAQAAAEKAAADAKAAERAAAEQAAQEAAKQAKKPARKKR